MANRRKVTSVVEKKRACRATDAHERSKDYLDPTEISVCWKPPRVGGIGLGIMPSCC